MTEFAPDISLSRSLTEPSLFGNVFAAPSFWTWRTVAKLIDGLPLGEPREIELFKQCSGRTQLLDRNERRSLRRFLLLVGRRGGKDRFLSAVAVRRAALCTDWRRHISAGEQAVVLLLGRDKKVGGNPAPLLSRAVADASDSATSSARNQRRDRVSQRGYAGNCQQRRKSGARQISHCGDWIRSLPLEA